MPVLKIKQTDGTWKEVWGATIDTNSVIPKLTSITVLADAWVGSVSPYSQIVECNGVSANSKVDLMPSPEQIVELQEAEVSLMASNNNGTVTIYALGELPTSDYTMNVLITGVTIV